MTTIWGDPIEVNGICPEWLTKDDVCDIHTSCWRYSHETRPHTSHPGAWAWKHGSGNVNITKIRLPKTHPYYTVQKYNLDHGTGFVYWPGGETMPDDYEDGLCLWRGGYAMESCQTCRWNHECNDFDIIGYTKKEEQKMANDFPPDWAIEKAIAGNNGIDCYETPWTVEEIKRSGRILRYTAMALDFAQYIAEHEPAPIVIDPDLLLAREVVAAVYEKADCPYSAQQARSGEDDDELEMAIALAAIKACKERGGL